MEKQQLFNPELLKVEAPNGGFYIGGSQHWFKDSWKRTSGCGPTTASGILWYLSRSKGCGAFCGAVKADTYGFLTLMDTVFSYVTPGMGGVYSSKLFINGLVRYGSSIGIGFNARALDIKPFMRKRPSKEAVRDFILDSLKSDTPVAFLNLSNGSLINLDSWHWVMLTALEPDSMTATICDNGGTKEIHIGQWLKTTVLGGSLVSVSLRDFG